MLIAQRTVIAYSLGGLLGIGMIASGMNTYDEVKYKTCVNQVAYEAYVEDDVGDTFDAGFDAGIYAAKVCSE